MVGAKNPPTCVSSEGGGRCGHKSPPSLESRVGGVVVGSRTLLLAFRARVVVMPHGERKKPSYSCFERGRWSWWVQIPSVTRIASGRSSGRGENPPTHVSNEGG